jgi:hypothetical protein
MIIINCISKILPQWCLSIVEPLVDTTTAMRPHVLVFIMPFNILQIIVLIGWGFDLVTHLLTDYDGTHLSSISLAASFSLS